MTGTALTVRPKTATPTPTGPDRLEIKELAPFPGFVSTKVLGEGEGIVQAIVAVTGNVDDGGDIIEPGAFAFDRHPKGVWSHDLNRLIAKVLKYEEWAPGDPHLPADLLNRKLGALVFDLQFDLLDPESHSAYRKVLFHEDLGWSIGYQVPADGFWKDKDGRRHLTKVIVWEASPTTFGMNREARTVMTKSAIPDALKALRLPEAKAEAVAALLETLANPAEGEEKQVLADSFEETQENVRGAVRAWGIEEYGEVTAENDWWVSVDGTFDDAVVCTFRFYSGQGSTRTVRFPYELDEEGAVLLGEVEDVELQVVVADASGGDSGDSGGDDDEETAMTPEVAAKAIEELTAEVKAGRVLSAANASRLKEAMDTIAAVLAAAEKEAEKEKAKTEKRTVVPKTDPPTPPVEGKGQKPEGEGDEVDVLEEKDVLEMLALANS